MKIVFAGTPAFAAGHLQHLLSKGHPVHAVLTQPDRPAGRGKTLTESPVKQMALAHGLDVYQPVSLRTPEASSLVASLSPDVLVVVAYGLILPPAILELPRYGCINVHASLLPRWRGAAPIQRAIEAGDTETGISIMQMDEGLDTGDVLMTATCAIEKSDTCSSLHDKLLKLGGPALSKTLLAIGEHTASRQPQDERYATYAKKISKTEAHLDWKQPANLLERKIRAFNPAPVAFFESDGEPVRVWGAICSTNDKPGASPGIIIRADKTGIDVGTGQGVLTLLTIQLPGKKPLPVHDVLNAFRERFAPGKMLT